MYNNIVHEASYIDNLSFYLIAIGPVKVKTCT